MGKQQNHDKHHKQEPSPSGDHKAAMNRRESMKTQDINNTNDLQKKYRLRTVSKNILLEGINWFHGAPTSPLVQIWIKTLRVFINMKDPYLILALSPRKCKSRYKKEIKQK